MDHKYKAFRYLGLLGIISFLSYLLAVVFSPLAYPGYDWMSQAVSDLSAEGAPSLGLWKQLSCLYGKCGIISIMAVAAFVHDEKIGNKVFRAGIYLFTLMNWISAVGYDLFPLSQAGMGMKTFQDFMHVYVVTAGVVITSILSLVCIIIGGIMSRSEKSLAVFACLSLFMMITGAVGSGIAPKAVFGIFERFSVFSATTFNAVLGFYLYKKW